jgi:hypothetical protein
MNRGYADRLTMWLNEQPATGVGQCGCGILYAGIHSRIVKCICFIFRVRTTKLRGRAGFS